MPYVDTNMSTGWADTAPRGAPNRDVLLHVEHPGLMTDQPASPEVHAVDVALIQPNPFQPRTVFSEEELADLAASIAKDGVLQPVTLRRSTDGIYQVVMGERRLRATRLAGLPTIPAIVRDVDELEMRRLALIENIHRSDLNLIEEALAYKSLADQDEISQGEIAELVGKSRQRVNHLLGLLRLPEPVQRRLAAGVITLGHAKALLAVPDPVAVQRLADRIVNENLTVRAVEEIVALGEWNPATKPSRSKPAKAIEVPAVMDSLSRWLDTRVKVVSGRNRGKIIVEFSDLEDLHRLLETLAAPAPETLIPE
jgi:ParB family chromosome partitioning protein